MYEKYGVNVVAVINDVQNSREIHRSRFYRRRAAFVDIPHFHSLTIIKVIVTRRHGRISIFIRIIYNVLCEKEKKIQRTSIFKEN